MNKRTVSGRETKYNPHLMVTDDWIKNKRGSGLLNQMNKIEEKRLQKWDKEEYLKNVGNENFSTYEVAYPDIRHPLINEKTPLKPKNRANFK